MSCRTQIGDYSCRPRSWSIAFVSPAGYPAPKQPFASEMHSPNAWLVWAHHRRGAHGSRPRAPASHASKAKIRPGIPFPLIRQRHQQNAIIRLINLHGEIEPRVNRN
jgi:hypothetical protein